MPRGGDVDALVALLDPDVVLRTDVAAERGRGCCASRRGARDVVAALAPGGAAPAPGPRRCRRARRGRPAGVCAGAIVFTIDDDGRIVAIDVIGDRVDLDRLDIVVLDD